MDINHLKTIIADQKEMIDEKFKSEKIIPREGMSPARKALKHPNILLVTGMRRAGKSIFSRLVAENFKYTHVNFDDERLAGFKLTDFNTLLESLYQLYGDFSLLILDEIQNVSGWELFAGRLRNKYRIIITGSNANLLGSELATHLTGRFLAQTVFPLSFPEFLEFRRSRPPGTPGHSTKEKSRLAVLFGEYLVNGGIFERYKFGPEFLRTMFSSIITKDIAVRHGIRHAAVLEELGVLAVNYFTGKLSMNKITAALKIKSPHTTREYLKYMEDTFLLFTLNRFSRKVKEQLSTLKKIYVTDNGMVNALNLNLTPNRGRLLENLVACQLKRRSFTENFQIFYWEEYDSECDFLIKTGTEITSAIQVCLELNFDNRHREITGLTRAMKEFGLKEGLLLTENQEETIREENMRIRVLPAWNWLLSG